MEEPQDDAARVGPAEREVLDAFDPEQHEGGCFQWVSFVQYAPDGENVMGEVFFFVCPLCGSMLPAPNPERSDMNFDERHVDWHLRQARVEDR